jgi:hypothetical protein
VCGVPFNAAELQGILEELDDRMVDGGLSNYDQIFNIILIFNISPVRRCCDVKSWSHLIV